MSNLLKPLDTALHNLAAGIKFDRDGDGIIGVNEQIMAMASMVQDRAVCHAESKTITPEQIKDMFPSMRRSGLFTLPVTQMTNAEAIRALPVIEGVLRESCKTR